MEIVFNEFRDRLLSLSESLGGRFSDFFSLESKLENEGFFCDVTDPLSRGTGGGAQVPI